MTPHASAAPPGSGTAASPGTDPAAPRGSAAAAPPQSAGAAPPPSDAALPRGAAAPGPPPPVGRPADAVPPVPLDTPLELPATADTEALGERLAAGLRAGDLVVLSGPLGAGKTALVRGLARGLRVAGPVTSPTFVIAREHRPLPGGAGVPLVHVDAYRLATAAGPASSGSAVSGTASGSDAARAADVAAELDDLDLDTDLAAAVVAVEWGEGVVERLAARHLRVRLDRRSDDVRVATVHRVEPVSPDGAAADRRRAP